MNPNGTPPLFPLLPDGTRDLQHDRPFTSTWRDMEALQHTGKVRAIGAASFDVHNLEVLRKECTIIPAVNQVELHPYLQQRKLKKYCDAAGIHITAYSP
jgi:glycerol 2-dehydrogenase (NADP+)